MRLKGYCICGDKLYGREMLCPDCTVYCKMTELKGWVPISAPMIDPRWKEPSAIVLARDLFIEVGKKDAELARLSKENNRLTALVEEKEKALADDVDLLAELQVSESRLRVLLAEVREENIRLQREASTRLAKRGLLVKTSRRA